MAIVIDSVEYAQENTTGSTNYLVGNIYQKITVGISFRVLEHIILDTNYTVTFAPTIYGTSAMLANEPSRFANLSVGDTIAITGTTSNNTTATITQKLSDSLIFTNATFTNEVATAGTIKLTNEPKGITYDYGLIENNEQTNFLSKVDGNLMRYQLESATFPSTLTTMTEIGKKSWRLGSTQVRLVSADNVNYVWEYEIEQVFYIHPFYQLTDLPFFETGFGSANSLFALFKCLKHAFRIRATRDIGNPNIYQEVIYDQANGNTGWYDENYNGGQEDYSLNSITYSNTINQLTKDDVVTVTVVLNDPNNDIEYATANFILLPETSADYIDNGYTFTENFCFDRALQQQGVAAVNGANFGTTIQVFENVTVTRNNDGTTTMVFDVNFGTWVKTKIDNSTDKNYIISISAVKSGQATATANYTTLFIDFNQIGFEVADTIVEMDTSFIPHDVNAIGLEFTPTAFKVHDEYVASTLWYLDTTNYPTATINKLNVMIVAKDSVSGDEAILQRQEFDFSGLPTIGGAQFINATLASGYNALPSEIRSEVKCLRDNNLDVGGKIGYFIQFPFIVRWEDWVQLVLKSLPNGLFDANELWNGYNQNWARIEGLTNWSIVYRIESKIVVNGLQETYINDTTLPIKGFETNTTDWSTPTIKTYDGATELTNGGSYYIKETGITRVEAEITYVGLDAFVAGNYFMVASLIKYSEGTVYSQQTLSSIYNREPVSNLRSIDSTGKIVITSSGNTIKGTFYIDASLIDTSIDQYTIAVTVQLKQDLLQDQNFVFQNGDQYIWQNGDVVLFN